MAKFKVDWIYLKDDIPPIGSDVLTFNKNGSGHKNFWRDLSLNGREHVNFNFYEQWAHAPEGFDYDRDEELIEWPPSENGKKGILIKKDPRINYTETKIKTGGWQPKIEKDEDKNELGTPPENPSLDEQMANNGWTPGNNPERSGHYEITVEIDNEEKRTEFDDFVFECTQGWCDYDSECITAYRKIEKSKPYKFPIKFPLNLKGREEDSADEFIREYSQHVSTLMAKQSQEAYMRGVADAMAGRWS